MAAEDILKWGDRGRQGPKAGESRRRSRRGGGVRGKVGFGEKVSLPYWEGVGKGVEEGTVPLPRKL